MKLVMNHKLTDNEVLTLTAVLNQVNADNVTNKPTAEFYYVSWVGSQITILMACEPLPIDGIDKIIYNHNDEQILDW